ncbi:MAG: RCC1 domain-containing protein, partial [Mycoplasma sp.]
MKKTNKKIGKYLIAPIVSLFTLVTIGASVGFSPSGSLGSLGNTVAKAKMETAEAFSVLKGDDVKIDIGGYQSAAIVDKKLFMWGKNNYGQLGIANKVNQNKPVYVDVDGDKNPNNDNVLDVALGDNHSSALTSSGLYTWGSNSIGQLGLGTSTSQYETPQKVTISGTPTQISMGGGHSSALTSSGLYTWGYNSNGQLGLGNTTLYNTPQKVTIPVTPTKVALGSEFSSALTSSGLYTWGSNNFGQLGLGTSGSSTKQTTPQKVTALSGTPTQISLGTYHSSALTSSGLYTWGYNGDGQLGIGTNSNKSTPTLVDNSSNLHKDLNILDLTAVTDTDNLKNKTTGETTPEHLINLIKNNNSRLFDKYTSDSVITIKDVVRTASYKEGNVLLGKITYKFNNDQQSNWLGYQNINGVKYAPGNVDKEITVTKFKKSETKNISKIEAKVHDKTYSVDDLVEELTGKLDVNNGVNPNRDTLNKFLDFNDFPSAMKVTKADNLKKDQSNGTLTMDLTVDQYTEEGTTGETVPLVKTHTYTDVKIENLRTPDPTIVDIVATDELKSTVTSIKLMGIINNTPKNKVDFQKSLSDYFDFS